MRLRMIAWAALAALAATPDSVSADRLPDATRFGLTLELPLVTILRLQAVETGGHGYPPIDHSDVTPGPLLRENDYGPQVPLMIGFAVRVHDELRVGLRFGIAPLCLDGPSFGEQGKDVSWQVDPFASYTFRSGSRLWPYLAAGPFVAHSCTGNTVDQNVSTLFGLHGGPGLRYAVAETLFAFSELRLRASWGEHDFKSHGEAPVPYDDCSDLRGQWVLGFGGEF